MIGVPYVCSDGIADVPATVEASRAIDLALAPLGQSIDRYEVCSVLAIRVREHSPHTLLDGGGENYHRPL